MADLLKTTIEKKDTKMVIISTSCSSTSKRAFSNLIIPATISVVLGSAPLWFHKEEPCNVHLSRTKEISSPHWCSWFNSLLSVTSSVNTPNMVQAVTETPKALWILLCKGLSHLSCCWDLNRNNVKISSKKTHIFFGIKNYHQNNLWLYVQRYLKEDEIQTIWKTSCYYWELKSAVLNKL